MILNKTAAAQESLQQNTYTPPGNDSAFSLGPEQQGIIYAGLVLLVMVAVVVLILRKRK